MSSKRLVILDKNFLQKEDASTPRLRALALAGCELVLIDTLIYELCSDTRFQNLWKSLQRKLFPFADRLHLWFHTAELLRQEVDQDGPINEPEDTEATQRLRDWIRSCRIYEPSNLQAIDGTAQQQREVDSMEKVAPMARAVGSLIADALNKQGITNPTKEKLGGWVIIIIIGELYDFENANWKRQSKEWQERLDKLRQRNP